MGLVRKVKDDVAANRRHYQRLKKSRVKGTRFMVASHLSVIAYTVATRQMVKIVDILMYVLSVNMSPYFFLSLAEISCLLFLTSFVQQIDFSVLCFQNQYILDLHQLVIFINILQMYEIKQSIFGIC